MPEARQSDTIAVTDSVTAKVELGPREPRYPCPQCGKESKLRPEPGWLICSLCRHEWAAELDWIEQRRDAKKRPIEHACPKCGKPSRRHKDNQRICSMPPCRHVWRE